MRRNGRPGDKGKLQDMIAVLAVSALLMLPPSVSPMPVAEAATGPYAAAGYEDNAEDEEYQFKVTFIRGFKERYGSDEPLRAKDLDLSFYGYDPDKEETVLFESEKLRQSGGERADDVIVYRIAGSNEFAVTFIVDPASGRYVTDMLAFPEGGAATKSICSHRVTVRSDGTWEAEPDNSGLVSDWEYVYDDTSSGEGYCFVLEEEGAGEVRRAYTHEQSEQENDRQEQPGAGNEGSHVGTGVAKPSSTAPVDEPEPAPYPSGIAVVVLVLAIVLVALALWMLRLWMREREPGEVSGMLAAAPDGVEAGDGPADAATGGEPAGHGEAPDGTGEPGGTGAPDGTKGDDERPGPRTDRYKYDYGR